MHKKSCFVISPIENDPHHYSTIFFEKIIKKELMNDFDIIRSDKLPHTGNILNHIIQHMDKANLVIADLTDLNPNVLYELGIRTHTRKPVIQFIQDIDELPFDLKPIRTIQYNTEIHGIDKARENLTKMVSEIDFDQNFFNGLKLNNLSIITQKQISIIEKGANEIWICSTTLERDTENTDIKSAVKTNLEQNNKKYLYFLPKTKDIQRNLHKFVEIYKEYVGNKLHIIPIPSNFLNLFEEIAIYYPKYQSEKISDRIGYTMLTITDDRYSKEESEFVYLKIADGITHKLVNILGKIKDNYQREYHWWKKI